MDIDASSEELGVSVPIPKNEIVSHESVVDNDYWGVIKSAVVLRRTIFFAYLNV